MRSIWLTSQCLVDICSIVTHSNCVKYFRNLFSPSHPGRQAGTSPRSTNWHVTQVDKLARHPGRPSHCPTSRRLQRLPLSDKPNRRKPLRRNDLADFDVFQGYRSRVRVFPAAQVLLEFRLRYRFCRGLLGEDGPTRIFPGFRHTILTTIRDTVLRQHDWIPIDVRSIDNPFNALLRQPRETPITTQPDQPIYVIHTTDRLKHQKVLDTSKVLT